MQVTFRTDSNGGRVTTITMSGQEVTRQVRHLRTLASRCPDAYTLAPRELREALEAAAWQPAPDAGAQEQAAERLACLSREMADAALLIRAAAERSRAA